mmetsp:Transcript_66136/g.173398  ORF Transcript_66136/g.173398 Transcript_66136/m.173398 type:complete len:206 (+) Transcript_66136:957-1574(+)
MTPSIMPETISRGFFNSSGLGTSKSGLMALRLASCASKCARLGLCSSISRSSTASIPAKISVTCLLTAPCDSRTFSMTSRCLPSTASKMSLQRLCHDRAKAAKLTRTACAAETMGPAAPPKETKAMPTATSSEVSAAAAAAFRLPAYSEAASAACSTHSLMPSSAAMSAAYGSARSTALRSAASMEGCSRGSWMLTSGTVGFRAA